MKLILILIPLLLGSVESKVKVVKRPTPPTTLKPTSPYCQPKLCQSGQEHVACEKFSSVSTTPWGSQDLCNIKYLLSADRKGLEPLLQS